MKRFAQNLNQISQNKQSKNFRKNQQRERQFMGQYIQSTLAWFLLRLRISAQVMERDEKKRPIKQSQEEDELRKEPITGARRQTDKTIGRILNQDDRKLSKESPIKAILCQKRVGICLEKFLNTSSSVQKTYNRRAQKRSIIKVNSLVEVFTQLS